MYFNIWYLQCKTEKKKTLGESNQQVTVTQMVTEKKGNINTPMSPKENIQCLMQK